MSSGNWTNQDNLPLQFGTAKALPDWSGEYHVGSSSREVEFLVPLISITMGGYTIPAIPTTFSGTTTFAAAGISNPDLLFPMQTTAVQTTSSSAITISKPQLFIEQVQITSLSPMAGGTSLAIGFATIDPSTQQFAQVTPNTGVQLVDTLVTATFATTAGLTTTWNRPGSTGYGAAALTAGGGAWIKQMPLVTNSFTPLPQNAWISAIATGTFTDGVLKVKVRYSQNGSINQ